MVATKNPVRRVFDFGKHHWTNRNWKAKPLASAEYSAAAVPSPPPAESRTGSQAQARRAGFWDAAAAPLRSSSPPPRAPPGRPVNTPAPAPAPALRTRHPAQPAPAPLPSAPLSPTNAYRHRHRRPSNHAHAHTHVHVHAHAPARAASYKRPPPTPTPVTAPRPDPRRFDDIIRQPPKRSRPRRHYHPRIAPASSERSSVLSATASDISYGSSVVQPPLILFKRGGIDEEPILTSTLPRMVSTSAENGPPKPKPSPSPSPSLSHHRSATRLTGGGILSAQQSPGRNAVAKSGHPANPHLVQRRMPSVEDLNADGRDDNLAYYKSQIQQLEAELNDFQASSRELEAELEKELEASEKQHRDLSRKNEKLRYEVEEWKAKYNKSKQEANTAQNQLQKEVTELRKQNRDLQGKLRDVEVSNDDFEKKERIVQSSLEDVEQKYNSSIERAVLLEESMRVNEQEREQLRIESQRLRDELTDLKVEQELTEQKLDKACTVISKYGMHAFFGEPSKSKGPFSETSSVLSDGPSTPSGGTTSTMTPQSDHASPSPPSPPISEASSTPSHSSRLTGPLGDPTTTPRPHTYQRGAGQRKHSRGPSMGSSTTSSTTNGLSSTTNGLTAGANALQRPNSKSLYQIRGLIGQMQRLEARVQNVRSKLPGPPSSAASTPPRASPRLVPLTGIPNTITMRSAKKSRPPGTSNDYTTASRLSFGPPGRPASRMGGMGMATNMSIGMGIERPDSRTTNSRPSSRASGTTTGSRSSFGGGIPLASGTTGLFSGIPTPSSAGSYHRPPSRQSMSGRMTPLETHAEDRRDRRSLGLADGGPPMRRNTLSVAHSGGSGIGVGSAIPVPGIPRRATPFGGGRRMSAATSTVKDAEDARRKMAAVDLNETY